MSTLRPIPPSQYAAEQLEALITRENLQAHSPLPSERDLCHTWAVSRSALRRAIRKLSAQGKIYSKAGSGTFVGESKADRNLKGLESLSHWATRRNFTISSQILDSYIFECTKTLSKALWIPLGQKVFYLKRLRLLNHTPYMIEEVYLDYSRFPSIQQYDLSLHSLYEIMESVYGVVIQKGCEKVNLAFLDENEARILELPTGSPAFYTNGTVFDEEGYPIQLYQEIIRQDQFQYAWVTKSSKAAQAQKAEPSLQTDAETAKNVEALPVLQIQTEQEDPS